jgi:3-dehydroshikimate dehydratase
MIPGLVSISFRAHRPKEIAAAAAAAGLQTIEWGGDVHVPPARYRTARMVARITSDAGLTVAAYGSYYYAGESHNFEEVLETALLLHAPVVRVWSGKRGSRDASARDRARVTRDLARCAELAARTGVRVATEFHAHTLTDTATSTVALLTQIGHPNLRTYWQPPHGIDTARAAAGLHRLASQLEHVHVFHWWPGPERRLPLYAGLARWTTFLRELAPSTGQRAALLEFMPTNSLAELAAEAATLRELLRLVNAFP